MLQDFLEALVRVAALKGLPTDEEVSASGKTDGGELLLALMNDASASVYHDFVQQHAPSEQGVLNQPIERCVMQLVTLLLRVEGAATAGGKKLEVTRAEVASFKRGEAVRTLTRIES